MRNRYKVILSNKNIYREIYLAPDQERVVVGTELDADVRFHKELFFGAVRLEFLQSEGRWSVYCSDDLFFNAGDARKLIALWLLHGMECKVCGRQTGNAIFTVSFFIDFDYEEKDYDRKIDISEKTEVKIGSEADADIVLEDEYLEGDRIVLTTQEGGLALAEMKSRYGVSVNGVRVQEGAVIRERDFFSVACFSFYYKEGVLYTSRSKRIQVRGLKEMVEKKHSTVFVYPKFQRNTRISYKIERTEIEIRPPAAMPVLHKKGIVYTVLPALVMFAMTIILRGVIGGGGAYVAYSAVSMGMGILMSVAAGIQDSREYKEKLRQRQESYHKYLREKHELIQASRAEELRIQRLAYAALEESLEEVWHFGRRLFEKSAEDQDFLQVYLGTGRMESVNQVKYDRQEFADQQDPLAVLPEQMAEAYRFVEDAPITVNLKDTCAGVVGGRPQLKELLKNVSLDLAIRHFYKEVKLVYVLDGEWTDQIGWIRWLRNVENESLDVRNILCDEESRKLLLEYLYGMLSEREQILTENKDAVFGEHYVVLVTDSASVCRHPVFKYVECCADYGFTFVFFEEHEEKVPRGCGRLIYLGEEGRGQLFDAGNREKTTSFVWPRITDLAAKSAARRLGAICVDEVTLEEQLTKSITIFELLGIISVDDLDLEKRWGESKVYQDMTVPVGKRSGGETAVLDISDRVQGHGPHGLVAGTTGSGKSEMLQTYILSAATLFHPYDVSFVIIDFKGGGMANQFEALPHLTGAITNIDGREIGRSLLSIKAELVRRQELLSEACVNHINEYIQLYKAGRVDRPMPHMVMIVDEFAELKAEYPDFMKELISAARIGRTLGIHLILATQKPAGVVDAQIWSNSRFRLCLKVQTKEDSNEVLKTPLAAEIVEPGRAYFQVGNNETFDLIQSAYSGGAVPSGGGGSERVYSIYERNLWGKKSLKYTSKKAETEKEKLTQLQALVDHIACCCARSQIRKLPGICLPPLQTVISADGLHGALADSCKEITVSIGRYDDPEQQRQGEVLLELSRDNVYITGSGQTGKTVLLQTICYGLLRNYTPEQVNLYLVDCGSMVLQMFEVSAHVGGVVLAGEEEKCRNLFKLLKRTIVWRKKQLAGRGVGSFSSYLEAGFRDMPMVAVMIDNMAAFREYFPEQSEEIGSLSREAQGVGIAFIITSAASSALNYRTQANFGRKLALNCNDGTEYSNLFGHCRLTPGENPGRGLFMMDKRILEWQAAVYGGISREGERNRKLGEYIVRRNASCRGAAEKIPMVPERLGLKEAMRQEVHRFRVSRMIPVGMDYSTVDYSILSLRQAGALALLGENESRICFVRAFMHLLAANIVFHNVEAVVVDDGQRGLEVVKQYGFVRRYVWGAAEGASAVEDFCDELCMSEEAGQETDSPMSMLVIHNLELLRRICADQKFGKKLAKAVRQARNQSAFMLFAQVENQPVGFQSSEALKALKEEGQGILFAPAADSRFFEVGGRIKPEAMFDKSTGYRFDNGSCGKIRIFDLEE